MDSGLRIAHLSDPHFSEITYSASQFLSKRWLGNLNLILFRRSYQTDHLDHIPELLKHMEVEHVCITGDFSSTALDEEFTRAKTFVEKFHTQVSTLPGNHDVYTKEADETKRFYQYFPSRELQQERVEKKSLGKGWWWIGLDCAIPTPFFVAKGMFRETMEAKLEALLETIPKDECVVLGNHFPLIPGGAPMHDLGRARALQALLKRYPQVKLYLHGHDHKTYIKEQEGLPLIINSGSCAHKPGGTFYLLELFPTNCLVERLTFKEDEEQCTWVVDEQKHFNFRSS